MNSMQEMDAIISDEAKTREQKIHALLELGLNELGLGIALISRVENDVYTVKYALSPGDMIEPGTTFSIGETYCCHTLNAKRVTGFHNAGESEIATHPCYSNFKLNSYIGAPVSYVDGVMGTVNFSAAAPRDPFTNDEIALVNAMADWIGKSA